MAASIQTFDSKQILNIEFAECIANLLEQAIKAKGSASLAVSGGSTPKPLFGELSLKKIDWSKVTITLVDDRWLAPDHQDSNEKLVREHLMVNDAASARFVGLVNHLDDPFESELAIAKDLDAIGDIDVLILGMGTDGHTASLFPCSKQIQQGLELDRTPSVIAVEPTTASYQRISLTLSKILSAKKVYLHLVGDEKLTTFNDIIKNYSHLEKPIKAVCEQTEVDVMWAP